MKRIICSITVVVFYLSGVTFAAADNFKIGVHGPITGPAAEMGRYVKNGALIAMDDMNAQGGILGRKVEVIFGDDEAKPEVGVSLYERFMLRDKVDVVIGGISSSVNIAMQEAAARYDKLFVTGGPVSEILSDKVRKEPKKYWMYFKSSPSYKTVKPIFKEFFQGLEKEELFKPKQKTVVTIVEDTDYGRGLGATFEEALGEDGWKIISREVVKFDQADYTAQMSKLRALKPDLIYTAQTSSASSASLCKTFRESGLQSFFLAMYTAGTPEYLKMTGKASETLVWCVLPAMIPQYAKAFLDKYKDRFKEEPNVNAPLQYDAMMNVSAAIHLAKSTDSPKIAEAMLKIKNKGNCGTYQFDPASHEALSGRDFVPMLFYQIVDGKQHNIIGPESFRDRKYVTQDWLK
jgi:branched-chain amino acid transport system substrate-binding protein